MIASDLKHIDHQLTMTPSLQKAIEFLRLRGIHDLPDGNSFSTSSSHKCMAISIEYCTISFNNQSVPITGHIVNKRVLASTPLNWSTWWVY